MDRLLVGLLGSFGRDAFARAWVAWVVWSGCLGVVWSEPAGLDEGFGAGGMVVTPFAPPSCAHGVVVMQADGKIVVGGYGSNGGNLDVAAVRYNANGSLDSSLNGSGQVLVNQIGDHEERGRAIAVQADGKIVIAGSAHNGSNYDFAVVRLRADGQPDPTFGSFGRVIVTFGNGNEYARAVVLQSDGKIVVAGFARIGGTSGTDDIAVARLTDTGALDTDFGGDGKVTTGTTSSNEYGLGIAVHSGKIVVGGYSHSTSGGQEYFALARYTAGGVLDGTFNGTGTVITSIGGTEDRIHALAIQGDGKIVAAGYANNGSSRDFAVARYTTGGTLDTGFSGDGKLTTSFGGSDDLANSVAITGEGKIVVAGDSGADMAVVRYDSSGALDPVFSSAGKAVIPVRGGEDHGYGVAVQSDGKIVVAGSAHEDGADRIAVVRMLGTAVPEIEVEQPAGTSLADGGAGVDFGGPTVGGTPATLTFTVRNIGAATLTGLAVEKDGENAAEFTLGVLGATSLAAGASTTFTVSFAPAATGTRTAALHLASNDTNESSFDIPVHGIGNEPPQITSTSPLPQGMGYAAYNFTFHATGGTPPYTWDVSAGSLPNTVYLALVK